MLKFYKKKWLTLVEMIVVMTIFFLLLVVIVEIYRQMITIKNTTDAKQTLIQESYYILEKINVEMKNYSIDYEEYFNRSRVGCEYYSNYGTDFIRNTNSWNNNWYCNAFTTYGNQNFVTPPHIPVINEKKHFLYYCSSNNTSIPNIYNLVNYSGCISSLPQWRWQSYWEYALQFWDVKSDVDTQIGAIWDSDDTDLWKWPIAIQDSDNIQELYLISKDGNRRMFFRRALISSWDRNGDWVIGSWFEKWYTIQLLRLKGFDAGSTHHFDIADWWVYDWQIDTRACDYAEGFICYGDSISSILYSGYKLPIDENDGRVNIFPKNLTITDRNISISPTKKPWYARAEDNQQIQPYFTLSFTNKLYWEFRKWKILPESMENFELTLQTTFNTKTNY